MNYRSILIVTYGRSGSTLLQGVLNTIPDTTIRGENYDFCWGLYGAWKALTAARNDWGDKAQSPNDAWYGADRLNPERFVASARQLVLEQFALEEPYSRIGFKEIRYLDHLDELIPYLKFLALLFPQPAFVFNTRDHREVVNSAFWKKEDPATLTKRLQRADDIFFTFTSRHANAFTMRYETLIKGGSAIAPLFNFLGVEPDDEKVRQTLATPHSFVPKPATLGRAEVTRRSTAARMEIDRAALDDLVLDVSSRMTALEAKVTVLSIVKDEIAKLPWFIEYYRRLGCQAFLFIDNDSTDGSTEFLRQQPDVMLYRTDSAKYRTSRSGRDWVNVLTKRHALGKWVLCVDADELLSWPGDTREGLAGLTARAERLGLNRVFTPMIDAYSEQPTSRLPPYRSGQPFGDICPWVDPVETTQAVWDKGRLVLYGGPRNRFVEPGTKPPITSKQTLYLVEEDGYDHIGPHFDSYGIPSPLVAPLLHYKFMADFAERCDKNIREGNHWNNAQDYKRYKQQQLETKCFKNDNSVRITSGDDLHRHIQVISGLIRRQGMVGSAQITHRFNDRSPNATAK